MSCEIKDQKSYRKDLHRIASMAPPNMISPLTITSRITGAQKVIGTDAVSMAFPTLKGRHKSKGKGRKRRLVGRRKHPFPRRAQVGHNQMPVLAGWRKSVT